MLTETDFSCPEHSDCTATIYVADGEEIGRRHLHTWTEDRGGRIFCGHLNVGIYMGIDAEGKHQFDAEAVVLSGVDLENQDDLAANLNGTYPWANHHDGSKLVRGSGRRLPRAERPAVASGNLAPKVEAFLESTRPVARKP